MLDESINRLAEMPEYYRVLKRLIDTGKLDPRPMYAPAALKMISSHISYIASDSAADYGLAHNLVTDAEDIKRTWRILYGMETENVSRHVAEFWMALEWFLREYGTIVPPGVLDQSEIEEPN